MKQKLIISLLICLFTTHVHLFSNKYLENRIDPQNRRYATFDYCLKLLAERNAKILVETGTARSGTFSCCDDGCSTVIFGHWAFDHQAELSSVDISSDSLRQSKAATLAVNPHVHFVLSDSIKFLRRFSSKIDFLYLDSYDFDHNNPDPSQQHHLKEIQAAYSHLHQNSVIMVDDCDLPYGGKGKLVLEFLLEKGWEIALAGYQTILIHPDSK